MGARYVTCMEMWLFLSSPTLSDEEEMLPSILQNQVMLKSCHFFSFLCHTDSPTGDRSPQEESGQQDNNASSKSPPSNTLESTLMSLQQQQMIMMSVIHQLQTQILTSSHQPGVSPVPTTAGMLPFLVSQVSGQQLLSQQQPQRDASSASSSSSRRSRSASSSRRSSSMSPTTKSSSTLMTTSSLNQEMNNSSLALSTLYSRSSREHRSSVRSLNRRTLSPSLSSSSSRHVKGGSSPLSSPIHSSLISSTASSSKNAASSSGVKQPQNQLSSLESMSKAFGSNGSLFLHSNPTTSSSTEKVVNSSSSGILNAIIPPNISDPTKASTSTSDAEPTNTLALLEMHTEKALQNTMSGSSFLVNGMSCAAGGSDFLKFRKDGKEDPAYRHRCRYCGKVFGSDSALQIHIRSHTGERPFKCNVCGNRFSTKGNLKVHFQRHKAKYPHVKMNPNPVPEHLDKFHPPLEPPSGSQSPTRSESSPPPGILSMPPHSSSSFGLLGQSSSSLPITSSSSIDRSAPLFDPRSFPGQDFASRSMFASLLNQLKAQEEKEKQSSTNNNNNSDNRSTPEATESSKKNNCNPNESLDDVYHNDTSNSSHESDDRNLKRRNGSNPCHVKKFKSEEKSSSQSKGSSGEKQNGNGNAENESQEQEEDHENDQKDDKAGDELEDEGEDQERDPIDDMTNDTHDFSDDDDQVGDDDDPDTDGEVSNSGSNSGTLLPFMSGLQGFPAGFFPGMMMPGLNPIASFSGPRRRPSSVGGEVSALTQDPHLYQDLLPKPGSTDNNWESLMEIQKASETTKLQTLVDGIDQKVTDPNQCIICHRILSCKSALQMHYRTHTGERPFKCKICTRAFTTKGNLKTHMGVHRVKPPLRILHQCPVCHKQFTNALVLQQHIRMHTGEPTDIPHEHIMANEIKHPSHFLPPSFHAHMSSGLPPNHPFHSRMHPMIGPFGSPIPVTSASGPHAGLNPFFAQLMSGQLNNMSSPIIPHSAKTSTPEMENKKIKEASHHEDESDDDTRTPSPKKEVSNQDSRTKSVENKCQKLSPPSSPSAKLKSQTEQPNKTDKKPEVKSDDFSTSLAALEKQVRTMQSNNLIESPLSSKSDMKEHILPSNIPSALFSMSHNISPVGSKDNSIDERSTPGSHRPLDESLSLPSGALSPLAAFVGNGSSLDSLTPRSTTAAPVANVLAASTRNMSSPVITSPLLRPQMFPPLFAGLPFHAGKSSTTCRICLKTFACNSALEIHYRSHTKERPFKCDVCDRGFSTKGNMKQHMLTHKIRDLPSSLYTQTTSNSGSNFSMTKNRTPSLTDSNSQSSLAVSMSDLENENGKVSRNENGHQFDNKSLSPQESSHHHERHESGSSSPLLRRSSSQRHTCSVCTKPFSSHSALQIHMRTHTGDKPFKCSICGRAFTTKGNLKVHMGMFSKNRKLKNINQSICLYCCFLCNTGTHMWNNGSSRRGRRMSIDLPSLHVPSSPHASKEGFSGNAFLQCLPMSLMNGKL